MLCCVRCWAGLGMRLLLVLFVRVEGWLHAAPSACCSATAAVWGGSFTERALLELPILRSCPLQAALALATELASEDEVLRVMQEVSSAVHAMHATLSACCAWCMLPCVEVMNHRPHLHAVRAVGLSSRQGLQCPPSSVRLPPWTASAGPLTPGHAGALPCAGLCAV